MKFDYGPMRLHEQNAEMGDLFTSGDVPDVDDSEVSSSSKAKVIDLVLCIFQSGYVYASRVL